MSNSNSNTEALYAPHRVRKRMGTSLDTTARQVALTIKADVTTHPFAQFGVNLVLSKDSFVNLLGAHDCLELLKRKAVMAFCRTAGTAWTLSPSSTQTLLTRGHSRNMVLIPNEQMMRA